MQVAPTSPNTDQTAAERLSAPASRTASPAENSAARTEVSVKEQSAPIQNNASAPPASATPSAPDVTFKRDSAGQIYYVFTDPQTGDELREVPPKEIRSVGEGIADYLKQEQEKSTPHVQVKA